jgi:hypothetical protein
MNIDTAKIGLLAARALAKIERDYDGDEDVVVGDVVILVEMNRKITEPGVDDETAEDFPIVATEMLKVCTSPRWSVERGIIAMAATALDNTGYGGEGDGD